MALNRVQDPDVYEPEIDTQEFISRRTQGDPNKLVKLMERYAKAHQDLCNIFEAHDLDVDNMREVFTIYGEEVTNLYTEVIDD